MAGLRELLLTARGVSGAANAAFFTRRRADAGFDPVDHTEVDPRLGTWDDVAALGRDRDLVVDVIVNHVSSASPQYLDVVARGDDSPYVGMFLSYGSVFPDGATEDELLLLYRPRPGLPFTPVQQGERRRLAWTTFTTAQMDVDVRHPETRATAPIPTRSRPPAAEVRSTPSGTL